MSAPSAVRRAPARALAEHGAPKTEHEERKRTEEDGDKPGCEPCFCNVNEDVVETEKESRKDKEEFERRHEIAQSARVKSRRQSR